MAEIKLGNKMISERDPVFIIAELSGNHLHDLTKAKELIRAAYEAGADAIKLQTYTPDTISLDTQGMKEDVRNKYHTVEIDHPDWKGLSYHDLYKKVYTPWEWHAELDNEARKYGLVLFSTPFDLSAVDFLEEQNVPFYKIASYELVHLPLIKRIAQTRKPVIMSVGMGTGEEIDDAVRTLRENGCPGITLLHCISSYPAETGDLNLAKIQDLKRRYPDCMIGFSDHSLDTDAPAMAVGVGARVIERHLCLSRALGGPDSSFSSEPHEFRELIRRVKKIENSKMDMEGLKRAFPRMGEAYGKPVYGPVNDFEKSGISARPSIWINKDIKAGEAISAENLKIARPGEGLKPKYYEMLIGRRVKRDVFKGEPSSLEFLITE